ncbi:MAG: hypothetical protein NZ570_04840 [Candidatus Caldarchaeum sp.]|nr:hypothetical protein [Candidatus Caldarchaeum sp.]MCS7138191.1 hypothetical protein [Candidatus Caldarchaeum sp.]MDW8360051.1 hypothetical protein [Candidatus Caldarchaeum sp.]
MRRLEKTSAIPQHGRLSVGRPFGGAGLFKVSFIKAGGSVKINCPVEWSSDF